MSDWFNALIFAVSIFCGLNTLLCNRHKVGAILGIVLIFLGAITLLLKIIQTTSDQKLIIVAFLGVVLLNLFFIVLVKSRHYLLLVGNKTNKQVVDE